MVDELEKIIIKLKKILNTLSPRLLKAFNNISRTVELNTLYDEFNEACPVADRHIELNKLFLVDDIAIRIRDRVVIEYDLLNRQTENDEKQKLAILKLLIGYSFVLNTVLTSQGPRRRVSLESLQSDSQEAFLHNVKEFLSHFEAPIGYAELPPAYTELPSDQTESQPHRIRMLWSSLFFSRRTRRQDTQPQERECVCPFELGILPQYEPPPPPVEEGESEQQNFSQNPQITLV